jgi:hypothetical protein
MKKIYSIVAGLLLTASVFGQAPQKMSYQAVIRNSSSALVTSTSVGMKISVLQGSSTGTVAYSETQTISTNANGLVSLEIGSGSPLAGTFAGINWATGPYFIKTETDPTGGTTYSITGTSQLMSVPYALFSASGTTGAQGIQGIQGLPGANGTNGTIGATGLTGATGDAGTNGANGLEGATGDAGTNGANGLDGATGAAGTNGANGLDGAPGAAGTNGTNGLDGATGAAGTNGTAGLTGAAGLPTSVNAIAQIDGNITLTTTYIPEGDNKYYTDALVSANTDVAVNTSKVGITAQQSDAITANTDKVGYTEALVSGNTDVAANTAKDGITAQQSDAITTNTDKVGYTDALVSDNTDVAANTLKVGYTEALVSGNTDVAANTLKVDTNATSVNAAGALMDSELTDLAGIKAVTISTLQVIPSEGAFVDGDKTKLDGIEALIEALEYKVRFLEAQVPNAEVGDFRAGGVVFWLDPADNRHGLVCAIEDQSAGIQWYNGSFITTGATGTAIGAGRANTAAIIASQGTPETSYAAGLARVYGGGGYTDWFLPSKDALNQMFLNRAAINATATVNGGSSFTSNYYWSSTEFVSNLAAWGYNFHDQFQWYYFKDNTYGVRAVRAF